MIDLAQDLAGVFYGSDFAVRVHRRRAGVDDLEVMAIIGMQDDEVLDGRARAAVRTARFVAGQDVAREDLLVLQEAAGPAMPAGMVLRVIDGPELVNDGNEVEALLGSVAG